MSTIASRPLPGQRSFPWAAAPLPRWLALRQVGDGVFLFVEPLLFGQARLGLADPREPYYRDAWDYPNELSALAAMLDWNPRALEEPPGWHYHPFTGRHSAAALGHREAG